MYVRFGTGPREFVGVDVVGDDVIEVEYLWYFSVVKWAKSFTHFFGFAFTVVLAPLPSPSV